MDLEVLELCKANHIYIVLRPPHTSHILQGEDVVNFGVFKTTMRNVLVQQTQFGALGQDTEQARTAALSNAAGTSNLPKFHMGMAQLTETARGAWEQAFDEQRNLRAWRKTGYSPFDMCVYHDLLQNIHYKYNGYI